MPEERYLKEIASELRLIRKELQRMNNPPEPGKRLETVNIDWISSGQKESTMKVKQWVQEALEDVFNQFAASNKSIVINISQLVEDIVDG